MTRVVKVQFFADRIRLDGTLFLPDGAEDGPSPAVVFCHGFAATQEYVADDIAKSLARQGIAVLTFDHRGFGQSEGTKWRLLPLEQVEDIRSALVFLQTLPEIDPGRVGLYGISFGGAHALTVAAMEPSVKATVSCVPFADGRDWMRSMRRNWEWHDLLDRLDEDRRAAVVTGEYAEVDPDEILVRDPESLEWNEWLKQNFQSRGTYRLPLESARAIIDYSPIDTVDRVSNLLLIEAGLDILVPREHIRTIYERAADPKKLVTLPDATHHDIYRESHFDTVADIASAWLHEHL